MCSIYKPNIPMQLDLKKGDNSTLSFVIFEYSTNDSIFNQEKQEIKTCWYKH